jgi:multisubunit Na+/H+ antiporter MnhF subunit
MHTIVIYIALTAIIVMMIVCALLVVLADTRMTRVLALDTFTLIQVALLALFGYAQDTTHYLDAALVLALLAFVGTLAAARYESEGRLFS